MIRFIISWLLITGVLAVSSAKATQLLYVIDRDRVEAFGQSGDSLGSIGAGTGISNAFDLAIGPDGNIYVGNDGAGRIDYYTPDGNYLGVFAQPFPPVNRFFPSSMVFDDEGLLYAASSSDGVRVFDPNGVDLGTYGETKSAGVSPIRSIVFDGAGNLYASIPGVINSNGIVRFGKVIVFDPTGIEIGVFGETGDAGLLTPNDLAFDREGNLYVSARGRVELFSPTGAYLGPFGETTDLSLNPGGGLAFDHEGNLYVTDYARVRHYDPSGRSLGVYGDTSAVGLSRALNLVFAPVPEPSGLTAMLMLFAITTCSRGWRRVPNGTKNCVTLRRYLLEVSSWLFTL